MYVYILSEMWAAIIIYSVLAIVNLASFYHT